jgi:hypothetical protein
MSGVEGFYALNATDTRKWSQTERPSPTVSRPESPPTPPTHEDERRNNQTASPFDEDERRENNDE